VEVFLSVGDGSDALLRMALWEAQRGLTTCSCKIFVMTIQSDYESTSLFSPFQYLLLGLPKEDKEAMKVSCSCRIYEKADF
jgi:hypothetical protein